MNQIKRIASLVFGCWVCCMGTGCVSTYQPIQLEFTPIDDYWNTISGANVQIAMDYDVLNGSRNKPYAKMARKNKVSLVILSIQNSGQQELNIAGDLVFQISDGDSIQPMTFVGAMESLVDPVTDEENTSVVEVEGPDSWNLLWGAGKAVNETKTVVSHVRFVSDMSEHYLDSRILLPGLILKGWLVLPVKKDTPVEISLRQRL